RDKDLGLVLQAAKGGGVNHPVAIAPEVVAARARFFGQQPPARKCRVSGIGCSWAAGGDGHHGPRFDTSSRPPNYPLGCRSTGARGRPCMDASTFTVTERAAK